METAYSTVEPHLNLDLCLPSKRIRDCVRTQFWLYTWHAASSLIRERTRPLCEQDRSLPAQEERTGSSKRHYSHNETTQSFHTSASASTYLSQRCRVFALRNETSTLRMLRSTIPNRIHGQDLQAISETIRSRLGRGIHLAEQMFLRSYHMQVSIPCLTTVELKYPLSFTSGLL